MFRRRSLIAVCVLAVLIVSCVVYISQQYVAPILMYHSVNPSFNKKDRLTVSPLTFERQMCFLKDHGYKVIPLEVLAGLIREKKRIPAKTIAITLDDGIKDNYTYAFPILKKYNFPATVFIIVDEVGRDEYKLNWEEIRGLRDSGIIDLGSHAMGPDPLTKITSKEELRRQIFDSRKILEGRLGRRVVAFSYPEGRFNREIRQLAVDAGYLLAVATSPGRRYPNDDVFALKRLRVSESASNLFIFAVETSGFYTFFKEYKKHRHEKK